MFSEVISGVGNHQKSSFGTITLYCEIVLISFQETKMIELIRSVRMESTKPRDSTGLFLQHQKVTLQIK